MAGDDLGVDAKGETLSDESFVVREVAFALERRNVADREFFAAEELFFEHAVYAFDKPDTSTVDS